jgi:uncharacterized protein (TIGR02147 family)
MRVFEYSNYKVFLKAWIKSKAKKGHGEQGRMATHLRLHSTMLSHIINGDKDFSAEQAVDLTEYLGLNELESDYFFALVQYARAGSEKLKRKFKKNIDTLLELSKQVSKRIPTEDVMSEHNKAIFYSSYHYSLIRQLSSLDKYNSREEMIRISQLPRSQANQIIDFLLQTGLCVENKKIRIGPKHTHLERTSPLIWQHHRNWRIKAFDRHSKLTDEELMFTAPLTISVNNFSIFKEKLLQLIEELKQIVGSEEPETVACLNIDWIKLLEEKI